MDSSVIPGSKSGLSYREQPWEAALENHHPKVTLIYASIEHKLL